MEPLRYQSGVMRCERARFGFKIIKFCQGSVAFDSFYAFVALEPQNLNYFNNRYKRGIFSDFSVFGEEVLRGWGLIPPRDIIEHLQQKHCIKFVSVQRTTPCLCDAVMPVGIGCDSMGGEHRYR